MPKFCANISFLFKEAEDLKDRYKLAKEAGFSAVEIGHPILYDVPVDELAKAATEAGIQHVLINNYAGDQKGDIGTASLPSRREDFKKDLEIGIKYAKTLNCPRLHVLAGRRPSQWVDSAMDEVFLENIKYAADRLEKEGLTLMIEAINPRIIKGYYLDSPTKAIEVIQKVNKPNVKLQLDIFHLQTLAGDLTENIKIMLPYSDHVQIAQAPARNEINHEGEIDYKYILKLLQQLGYEGWIGLEYHPSTGRGTGSTQESLKWIQEWDMQL